MKNILKSTIMTVLVMCLFSPPVYANMAAPIISDIASTVTFEKNKEIAVLSEILDITVSGIEANIVATYRMKNTTGERISTQSMFLSPHIEYSGVSVLVNNKSVDYISDSYAFNYSTEIVTDDWQYIVLVDEGIASDKTVDTITFEMEFAPNEEYDVVVSYCYRLGGYPSSHYDAKRGEIEYYLAPAAMWKEFSSLIINLYLDEDMPIIKSSNLEFDKIDTRTYQYVSDTLPDENLEIVIDENWVQKIWSTLRSPYLLMWVTIFSPVLVIALAVIIFIVFRSRKKRRIS